MTTDYLCHIGIIVCIYSILSMSLDLLVGHTGLMSVAHAAFYGIGAYVSALVSLRVGFSFPVALIISTVGTAAASIFVALVSARLRGDRFVLATLSIQMIVLALFNNLVGATGGPFGLSSIPRPIVLGRSISSSCEFLVLALALAGLAFGVARRIIASSLGRVLRGVRDDETFIQALGKDVVRAKLIAVGISAALASWAGALYAHYVTYIDPTSFTVMESVLVLSMVIIGGAGSSFGPLVGALFLVLLPEGLRFLGLPNAVAANVRQVLYGLLLVGVLMLRPRGFFGRYDFGR